jgi:hypothetical protein
VPTGTGANVLSSLPDVPFVIDPNTFMSLTEGNTQPLDVFATPGAGQSASFFLPKSGVCSRLGLKFIGQLVVTTSGTQPVPGARWPYGLLSGFKLSAGLGAELFDVNGLDLTALHTANRPKLTSTVDVFPGAVGGGGSGLVAGTYPLFLSYDIPIAVDQTSLLASLFLQSSSASVQATITQEVITNLIASGGTAADWTITGSWYPQIKVWDIPIGSKGELILPEINRVHLVVGINQAITGTGRQPAAVQRTAGVLQRLFLRGELSPTSFLAALPGTATSALIDQIQINYGLTSTPLIYNPASLLAAKNNDEYGAVLPYDTYCIDTLVENPARDAILLQGVTNLQALMYVDPAVTVPAGALTRVVEEILV